MYFKTFKSSDTNVVKFVFEKPQTENSKAIAVEAVLYKYNTYEERTVICCSTQCGCPVGCSFCGTGKFFIRNLTTDEIVEQIETTLEYTKTDPTTIKKLQIMFMSMGEPFLNYKNTAEAIRVLHKRYPNADLLISTSAPLKYTNEYFNDFIELSKEIDKVGIQFSIHESNDEDRSKLIPSATSKLQEIGSLGEQWAKQTHRRPFFNYCVHKDNSKKENVEDLIKHFNPDVWECTLSVICEKDSTMKSAIESQLDLIKSFSSMMNDAGYSLRVFNPAGQDDIGGGCGQLWYFQEWLNKSKKQ